MAFIYAADRRHYLAGSTIAALEAVALNESFLHRMQLIAVCQSFDGGNFLSRYHCGKREAAQYPGAIDVHGTGSALTMIATFFGTGEMEIFPEQVQQGSAGIHGSQFVLLLVDHDGQRNYYLWRKNKIIDAGVDILYALRYKGENGHRRRRFQEEPPAVS